MKTSTIIFTCSHCGAQFQKWAGRCLECGKWGTVEKTNSPIKNAKEEISKNYLPIKTEKLSEISNQNFKRLQTNIFELDRVLGGGLVPGSLILLGGEPGIGKSTLALQLANIIDETVYFSGEESTQQIKMRASRLDINSTTLQLASTTNIENIIATSLATKSKLAIIDSIQTVYSDEVEGEAGNISQVRACTAKLMEAAKKNNITYILVGQVTKDGIVAGPKTLEHLVDTVLYLEGDRFHDFRILRAAKNRFGPTDEVGVFTMEKNGLQEVKNPSAAMISERNEPVSGTVITAIMEGTRPMLIEIQALVTKTNFGFPQRRASGFDLNRLQVLIGVLSRRAGLPLESYDVFLNVVGGLTADEPAVDLAVILAIASGLKDKTLPRGLAAFGEVGLSGEVRPVNHTDKRLAEIKNLGLEIAVIPLSTKTPKIAGLKIAQIKNVQEVVEKIIQK
ncbi:MAG: DNA repair protein RadA [Candidatus Magasanikbacteria bacterium RIFOXYD2_FULL_36_9]|uniref:DNA repair protein RadA n=1 Tax=Candidatus Magasanikbacteria bacterium RIFOXYD2_FULL_36_9 TaxID=1798707 RepID=A0A1F6NY50_9BACT|nr:MAG: DNA repair protein RadA [Candidatus Magasanikbacteria bacterium RIFOXYD2_FULL_36_9]